ncbi:hypothetical protein [Nocardia wallacei]|uniref:hypothetical protein n=1 Tax=Nocardia wallacei TaxID=480035 RepID=UPI002454E4DF|nr:hypothetical protein [Nocardia wallacei]
MTQPDGANPSGAHNPTHPGSFADWAGLTAADIADRTKAPIVGPTGSYTNVQDAVGAEDGNVIPSGSNLWQTFTRNADATFPRIMLTGANGVPDYQPAGHGANFTEIGFIEVSKDRKYSTVAFGTGDSVTALGITAMYAGAYLMDPGTGNLSLMAAVGRDIKAEVAGTNREYTFALPSAVDALKGEIWAVTLLQVTAGTQTCKSILAQEIWPMSAPPGFKPAALYAYGPATPILPSTIAYSSLTFRADFAPYYALS